MEDLNISINESKKFSDFWKYLFLLLKEGFFGMALYTLPVRLFWKDGNNFVIIKSNNQIIGGFFITSLPLTIYKPYNWFRIGIKKVILELKKDGYRYFSCFAIKKGFRNKGIGKTVFDEYLKKNHEKLWFTSSTKAKPFYIRNGAIIFYKSKYDIYTFNGENF